ncbi:MAG: type II secretion system protein GspC [Salinisphaeraceae bacterium]|jgi:general secretion pathway protein C|nr:type II secretion system protein GspC [Salinisphaeraceae bacterium]
MSNLALGRAQPFLQRLPAVANLVLVVLIGLMAARLFWQLWPVEEDLVIARPSAQQAAATNPASEIDIDRIAAANLFGEQKVKDEAETTEVINAPETQLNLTLTGIIASSRGQESRALIKDDKNEQKPYGVGDNITSGVDLHAIYSNRVILNRGGRFETLTLERDKAAAQLAARGNGAGNPAERGDDAQVSGALASSLGDIREEILNDPSRASEYLRINEERRDGQIIGYRIFPGRDRGIFQKLGLRPGEVVTEINGQALDNPAKSLSLLSQLAEAGSVTVTLQRGSSSRNMTVNFR